MSEKKAFGRGIVIVLGFSCIALAAALVFVVNEAYRLRSIVDLHESQIWLDHHQVIFESYGETDYDYSAGYAGYVTVQYESASPSMYIEVSYFALGLSYNRRVNLNTISGNFTFPVLPTSVRIAVGNLEDSQRSARITATYFY